MVAILKQSGETKEDIEWERLNTIFIERLDFILASDEHNIIVLFNSFNNISIEATRIYIYLSHI
jgi:hypothetical protein